MIETTFALMIATVVQPSLWHDAVLILERPSGGPLVLFLLAIVALAITLVATRNPAPTVVVQFKPRKLPFFSDDCAALDDERSAAHIIDDQRAKELHNIIKLSDRRRAARQ